ncbi:MAG: hypothetical protein SF029_20415 [bacterium]|nr:hypothetical protein [bacterium]
MRFLRGLGKAIWRFMVIFSFIVNIILVAVLIGVVVLIFTIKNDIAQPLVAGLHSSFVGLDRATIDWTIPVRADVPVNLDIPLQQNTIVTLTEPVPLTVTATILRQGVDILGGPVTVVLTLPQNTELPVALDLNVPVRDQSLPVSLDVRAVIPLQQTQLHDVAENLRLLFEPLAVGLVSLPNNFGEVFGGERYGRGGFVGALFSGDLNLLENPDAENYLQTGWPGYSITAGLNYPDNLLNAPVPDDNRPLQTGIVQLGGIPLLDQQLNDRTEIYDLFGGPLEANQQAYANLQQLGLNPIYYNGLLYTIVPNVSLMGTPTNVQAQTVPSEDAGIIAPEGQATGGPDIAPTPPGDAGVIPTPANSPIPPTPTLPPASGDSEDTGIIPTPGGG